MAVIITETYKKMIDDLLKQYSNNQFLPGAIKRMERLLANEIPNLENPAGSLSIDSGIKKGFIALDLECLYLINTETGDIAPFWMHLPRALPRIRTDQSEAMAFRKKVAAELGW